MKHHNLYRLAMIGYIVGGVFAALAFLMVFIAITFTGSPFEGLAWLFGVTGTTLLVGGGVAHIYAVENHKELKPLPKDVRNQIEKAALERRADLELERSLKDSEERTKIIQAKPVEPELPDRWRPPDNWR